MTRPLLQRRATLLPGVLLPVAILAAAAALGAAAEKDRFHFVGRIELEDGKPLSVPPATVFLHGAVDPFSAHTESDRGGKFEFKNLHAGLYTLTIAIPRMGEMSRTVVVGPSAADAKGRIAATFRFERSASAPPELSVSATELTIPRRAREEYRKAQDLLEKRDIEDAVKHLRRAVEIAPQFSSAWNNLGTIAYQSQRYKEAEEHFREALRQDPESYAPLVNLGGALLSQGRVEDSLEVNRRAVVARPNDALAHSQLGQSHFFMGQLELAERHLKRAKTLDAAHFSLPQLVLAEIYAKRNEYPALIRELEEFLKLHPDSEFVPRLRRLLENARSRAGAP